MAPKMHPEIVSREIVKPYSSIPNNHPTTHKLSFFDQLSPRSYIPLLFFYTTKHYEHHYSDAHKSKLLKLSLSSALSKFYPLAGRIIDDVSVDCKDEGALFLEARMECTLSEVLKIPDYETFKLLIPGSLYHKDSTLSSPVVVQATYFQGGGMSIGLCLCHKMLDMSSMCSFIKKWSSIAQNLSNSDHDTPSQFNLGSLYPPLDVPMLKNMPPLPQKMPNCTSRRLVFDSKNIAKLKELAADRVTNPTRVEVVTSFLYKSAIAANAKASTRNSGTLKPNLLFNAMNIRSRIFPPLSEGEIGNLFGMFPVSSKEEDFGWIVEQFRHEKTRFSDSCGDICNAEELYLLVLEKFEMLRKSEGYYCSSWCRFELYEAADFGWGKPFWVTTICWGLKNVIALMDGKGGDGIEAFVSLEEEAMEMFEIDQDVLEFCIVNPNVWG